jgi:CheY-like chemotaxis protein
MVVEDDELIREDLAQTLHDNGLQVIEARSGEAATGVLDDKPHVDALVTDINLGGTIDGWDVADRVRADHPKAVIAYASGNSSENPRRLPGSHFFTKPYRSSTILIAIKKWLGWSA